MRTCADYEDESDIDGQCRVIRGNSDERADIGADEFAPKADYSGDSIVNFIDFANLASAWKSENNPSITLDDDNDVDMDDLALFCEDWLWTGPCVDVYEMLARQSEGGSGVTAGIKESTELSEQISTTPVIEESSAVRDSTVSEEAIEQEPIPYEQLIPELLEWLDELWFSGELDWSEKEYLEFRQIIQELPG